jgi:hypothetical protein
MSKYTLSPVDGMTLRRDERALLCPHAYGNPEPGESFCGLWCAQFEVVEEQRIEKAQNECQRGAIQVLLHKVSVRLAKLHCCRAEYLLSEEEEK